MATIKDGFIRDKYFISLICASDTEYYKIRTTGNISEIQRLYRNL